MTLIADDWHAAANGSNIPSSRRDFPFVANGAMLARLLLRSLDKSKEKYVGLVGRRRGLLPLISLEVMSVLLRPEQPSDLALLTGGESPFDEFGPKSRRTSVRPAALDDAGALVVLDQDGVLAGDVTWHWVHWGPNQASRCPNIGIWLRPDARGRGIGRGAQRELAELFFAHTTVNRVEAHTDIENIAEQRALEEAGFMREGLTRGAQWRAGAYRDGYLYAMLRQDLSTNGT